MLVKLRNITGKAAPGIILAVILGIWWFVTSLPLKEGGRPVIDPIILPSPP